MHLIWQSYKLQSNTNYIRFFFLSLLAMVSCMSYDEIQLGNIKKKILWLMYFTNNHFHWLQWLIIYLPLYFLLFNLTNVFLESCARVFRSQESTCFQGCCIIKSKVSAGSIINSYAYHVDLLYFYLILMIHICTA